MTAEPRLDEPSPNTITRPYRGLSVQDVGIPLTPTRVEALLRGREIYRRTAYLVLSNEPHTALVAVRPERPDLLFSPVAELRWLSGPDTTRWIDDPATDVGNASSLADVRQLLAANPAPHYLLPCRGSGVPAGREVSFLGRHPPYHPGWLLIGCERSRQFHQHFHGAEPRRVELCPRARAAGPPGAPMLAKCCLLERGVQVDGATAVVPWGANLDEVRTAIRALCGLPAAGPPALGPPPAAAGPGAGT